MTPLAAVGVALTSVALWRTWRAHRNGAQRRERAHAFVMEVLTRGDRAGLRLVELREALTRQSRLDRPRVRDADLDDALEALADDGTIEREGDLYSVDWDGV